MKEDRIKEAAERYRVVDCGADATEKYLEKAFIAGVKWQQLQSSVPLQNNGAGEKSAGEIVEENFKGLSDFIKDSDMLHWYKRLIEECMIEFKSQSSVVK